ncbi:MAG: AMP-binding protein, partial [Pseudomonadota bacterium]
MSSPSGYWLSPQQERVVDMLARRERGELAASAVGTIAAGYCRGGVGRVQLIVRSTESVGLATLCDRLRAAMRQHQILRLRLVPRSGARRPLQSFVAVDGVDPEADGMVLDRPGGDVHGIAQGQWQEPFDLTREAPLRVVRVTGEDGVRLVLTASALALDTRSAMILARALCGAHEDAGVDDEPLDWLGASTFFREWLEDEDDEEAVADRAFFAGSEGRPPGWPRVHAIDRAADVPGGYERYVIPVPSDTLSQLEGDARHAEAAAVAMLLGFLARTSALAQPSLRVASSGREAMEELVPLLGPLARWLPTSTRVSGDEAVRDLTDSLASTMKQAREHELGFRDPVPGQAGAEGDDPGAIPAIAWVDANLGEHAVVEAVRTAETDAPWTLLLAAAGSARAPQLSLELDADRMTPSAIEALTSSLTVWLGAVAREGIATPLRRYPLVESVSPAAVVPGREPAAAGAMLFLERFLAAARSHGPSPAVIDDARSVSYDELEASSAALAVELRAAGAAPSRPVAAVMTRTHHAITAMLGAMRAGAPYLPLDPALPQAALRARLEDADAAIVLTDSLLSSRIPAEWPQRALDVTPPAPRGHGTVAPALPSEQMPAYLLYTSGSTGTPKAVIVTHRQLAEYVHAVEQVVQARVGARWGNLSTLAADLGHTTLFPPLASGGTIRLLGEEAMGNARVLADTLREAPLDVLKIVPSHLAALLDGAGDDEARRAILPREVLLCGGEALPRSLVERVSPHVPRVLNHYGPTETTVGAVAGDARAASADGVDTVPLGHPLSPARLHVLDRYGLPVPRGVVGELFIGGTTVAQGYHGRAALTASRFLPDPFAGAPGARMYRTG